jgi:hypothetical protein
MPVKPASFCALATNSCWNELYGLLLSLSLFHPNTNVYCMVDTPTKQKIDNLNTKSNKPLKLNITWVIGVDEYTNYNRARMEKENVFTKFLMKKCEIMNIALDKETDTLFLDSDMIILDEINDIDDTAEIGVSPHFIRQRDCNKFGHYNAGMLWTKHKYVVNDWIKFSKTSRYFEQAAIEDLVIKYKWFDFDKNYNFSWWRVFQSDENGNDIIANVKFNPTENKIMFNSKPLKLIHTHFACKDDNSIIQFNSFMIQCFVKCNKKDILDIIEIIMANANT